MYLLFWSMSGKYLLFWSMSGKEYKCLLVCDPSVCRPRLGLDHVVVQWPCEASSLPSLLPFRLLFLSIKRENDLVFLHNCFFSPSWNLIINLWDIEDYILSRNQRINKVISNTGRMDFNFVPNMSSRGQWRALFLRGCGLQTEQKFLALLKVSDVEKKNQRMLGAYWAMSTRRRVFFFTGQGVEGQRCKYLSLLPFSFQIAFSVNQSNLTFMFSRIHVKTKNFDFENGIKDFLVFCSLN